MGWFGIFGSKADADADADTSSSSSAAAASGRESTSVPSSSSVAAAADRPSGSDDRHRSGSETTIPDHRSTESINTKSKTPERTGQSDRRETSQWNGTHIGAKESAEKKKKSDRRATDNRPATGYSRRLATVTMTSKKDRPMKPMKDERVSQLLRDGAGRSNKTGMEAPVAAAGSHNWSNTKDDGTNDHKGTIASSSSSSNNPGTTRPTPNNTNCTTTASSASIPLKGILKNWKAPIPARVSREPSPPSSSVDNSPTSSVPSTSLSPPVPVPSLLSKEEPVEEEYKIVVETVEEIELEKVVNADAIELFPSKENGPSPIPTTTRVSPEPSPLTGTNQSNTKDDGNVEVSISSPSSIGTTTSAATAAATATGTTTATRNVTASVSSTTGPCPSHPTARDKRSPPPRNCGASKSQESSPEKKKLRSNSFVEEIKEKTKKNKCSGTESSSVSSDVEGAGTTTTKHQQQHSLQPTNNSNTNDADSPDGDRDKFLGGKRTTSNKPPSTSTGISPSKKKFKDSGIGLKNLEPNKDAVCTSTATKGADDFTTKAAAGTIDTTSDMADIAHPKNTSKKQCLILTPLSIKISRSQTKDAVDGAKKGLFGDSAPQTTNNLLPPPPQEAEDSATDGTAEADTHEEPPIPEVTSNDESKTPKVGGGGNALTMSGALGASRAGGRNTTTKTTTAAANNSKNTKGGRKSNGRKPHPQQRPDQRGGGGGGRPSSASRGNEKNIPTAIAAAAATMDSNNTSGNTVVSGTGKKRRCNSINTEKNTTTSGRGIPSTHLDNFLTNGDKARRVVAPEKTATTEHREEYAGFKQIEGVGSKTKSNNSIPTIAFGPTFVGEGRNRNDNGNGGCADHSSNSNFENNGGAIDDGKEKKKEEDNGFTSGTNEDGIMDHDETRDCIRRVRDGQEKNKEEETKQAKIDESSNDGFPSGANEHEEKNKEEDANQAKSNQSSDDGFHRDTDGVVKRQKANNDEVKEKPLVNNNNHNHDTHTGSRDISNKNNIASSGRSKDDSSVAKNNSENSIKSPPVKYIIERKGLVNITNKDEGKEKPLANSNNHHHHDNTGSRDTSNKNIIASSGRSKDGSSVAKNISVPNGSESIMENDRESRNVLGLSPHENEEIEEPIDDSSKEKNARYTNNTQDDASDDYFALPSQENDGKEPIVYPSKESSALNADDTQDEPVCKNITILAGNSHAPSLRCDMDIDNNGGAKDSVRNTAAKNNVNDGSSSQLQTNNNTSMVDAPPRKENDDNIDTTINSNETTIETSVEHPAAEQAPSIGSGALQMNAPENKKCTLLRRSKVDSDSFSAMNGEENNICKRPAKKINKDTTHTGLRDKTNNDNIASSRIFRNVSDFSTISSKLKDSHRVREEDGAREDTNNDNNDNGSKIKCVSDVEGNNLNKNIIPHSLATKSALVPAQLPAATVYQSVAVDGFGSNKQSSVVLRPKASGPRNGLSSHHGPSGDMSDDDFELPLENNDDDEKQLDADPSTKNIADNTQHEARLEADELLGMASQASGNGSTHDGAIDIDIDSKNARKGRKLYSNIDTSMVDDHTRKENDGHIDTTFPIRPFEKLLSSLPVHAFGSSRNTAINNTSMGVRSKINSSENGLVITSDNISRKTPAKKGTKQDARAVDTINNIGTSNGNSIEDHSTGKDNDFSNLESVRTEEEQEEDDTSMIATNDDDDESSTKSDSVVDTGTTLTELQTAVKFLCGFFIKSKRIGYVHHFTPKNLHNLDNDDNAKLTLLLGDLVRYKTDKDDPEVLQKIVDLLRGQGVNDNCGIVRSIFDAIRNASYKNKKNGNRVEAIIESEWLAKSKTIQDVYEISEQQWERKKPQVIYIHDQSNPHWCKHIIENNEKFYLIDEMVLCSPGNVFITVTKSKRGINNYQVEGDIKILTWDDLKTQFHDHKMFLVSFTSNSKFVRALANSRGGFRPIRRFGKPDEEADLRRTCMCDAGTNVLRYMGIEGENGEDFPYKIGRDICEQNKIGPNISIRTVGFFLRKWGFNITTSRRQFVSTKKKEPKKNIFAKKEGMYFVLVSYCNEDEDDSEASDDDRHVFLLCAKDRFLSDAYGGIQFTVEEGGNMATMKQVIKEFLCCDVKYTIRNVWEIKKQKEKK